ncbi:hypothetical protein HAX54_004771, partial [Datura stramonium]|nr:hypothetical protein [Datura stramonium]
MTAKRGRRRGRIEDECRSAVAGFTGGEEVYRVSRKLRESKSFGSSGIGKSKKK